MSPGTSQNWGPSDIEAVAEAKKKHAAVWESKRAPPPAAAKAKAEHRESVHFDAVQFQLEQPILGNWEAVELDEGGDPGSPDESLIEISASEISFPNGGGGFANGRYKLDASGVFVAREGDQSITFRRAGELLSVTFAGSEYGTGTEVRYRRTNP